VVGLGPGADDLITPRARNVILNSDVIIGYHSYIELLTPELTRGKIILSSGMRKEVERCSRAIDMAMEGRVTTIVCGGDAGIYGMAGLLLELISARGLQETLEIDIVSGIPAFVSVASLLGAPLMHDFAVISLSDLLTPWEKIEQRIESAASGDFVLVLYNPRSKKRQWQIERARSVILKHRAPETPVGIVRNATREDEWVRLGTLSGFSSSDLDMNTTLIVGDSSTRIIYGKMITPRGYFDKYSLNKISRHE
jgi:precorrin-3B C17-methyltransferase